MDEPFNIAEWQPTRPPEYVTSDVDDAKLSSLCRRLQLQTTEIRRYPYDPRSWYQRARTLTDLHYPELALGDAYKASLLCKGHRNLLDQRAGDGWRLGHCMGFWMRDEESDDEESRDALREKLHLIRARAERKGDENLLFFSDSPTMIGRYMQRPYPWMKADHRERSNDLMAELNYEFAARTAAGKAPMKTKCVVKRHAYGKGPSSRDILGVFALRAIAEDEEVLVDPTDIWGCNGSGQDGTTANLHGGYGCSNPLHPNQPSDAAQNIDLRWIRDRAGRKAAELILRSRLLLACTRQSPALHPLDHSLVARLTPTYQRQIRHTFTICEDYSIPNDALRHFGIDIFANPAYDTWVLMTLRARVENNSCGTSGAECLNPLFSLFNHSCEPNVAWNTSSKDHTTITVSARRDIAPGEQLFVEYDGFLHLQGLEMRRERMRRWLDGECGCSRCVREEAEGVDEGVVVQGVPAWDVQEKPVLPEDTMW